MKRTVSIFSYPVVLIETGGELTWVCPDLGVYTAVKLPDGKKIGTKAAVQVSFAWLNHMRKMYKYLQKKVEAGKPIPSPSNTKSLFDVDRPKKSAMSPKEVAKMCGVGENTVRRAIDKKLIRDVETTPGGHRRVAEYAALEFRDLYCRK